MTDHRLPTNVNVHGSGDPWNPAYSRLNTPTMQLSPYKRPKYRKDIAYICSVCQTQTGDDADDLTEFDSLGDFADHWDDEHW